MKGAGDKKFFKISGITYPTSSNYTKPLFLVMKPVHLHVGKCERKTQPAN